jgi:hypothetical protein
VQQKVEETIMNKQANGNQEQRKPSKFGWIFEEWVAHIVLVGAIVTVLFSGVASLNNLPGV